MARRKALKKKNNLNMRGGNYFRKIGSTNKLYRNSVPRTLQIATRRNLSQTLKFVSNQTYQVNPGGTVGGMQNTYLRIRANSIYDIMHENGANQPAQTFVPQDSNLYGPNVAVINAEGWDEWENRYYHFTVLGSRIQATFEPTGPGLINQSNKLVPTTFYINLSGSNTQLATGSNMLTINKLPYTKRASIVSGSSNANISGTGITSNSNKNGVRLHMNYSTKKFEGVKDVSDNSQLRGTMQPAAAHPAEGSYYTVGLRNTIPSGAAGDSMPSGILRLKIEYIVKLTEPTNKNQVQANGANIPFFGRLEL